jgi:hypothetical protein
MVNPEFNCGRCDWGTLKRWDELDEEQKEVAERLPASSGYSMEVRRARHRWCTRCWYEDRGDSAIET